MIDLLGIMAGCLSVFSFIPQILKILKTRSTRDISLLMYLVFFAGALLWLIYGILLRALPVILTNVMILLFVGFILILKLLFDVILTDVKK